MKPSMSADKQQVEVAQGLDEMKVDVEVPKKSSRLTKKHLLIGTITLLVVGLVVACVLVAMRIYTDSQVEITKYSVQNNAVNQTMSVENNIVVYRVVSADGTVSDILHDFDRDVQVIKLQESSSGVACYVTALNRSLANTPVTIQRAGSHMNGTTVTAVYVSMEDQIGDISFLGDRAVNLCNNIPTFWAVPSCETDNSSSGSRQRRSFWKKLKRIIHVVIVICKLLC